MYHDDAALAPLRAVVVVASAVLTACAAHAAAGGGSPGLAGLLGVAVLLAPLAAWVDRFGHRRGIILAGCIGGQLLAHIGLSFAVPSHHSMTTGHAGSHAPGAAGLAHATGDLAHLGHDPVATATGLGAAIDAGSGWAAPAAALTHALQMSPAMWLAHLGAALVTALLVAGAAAGARRILDRIVALCAALYLPATSATRLPAPPAPRPGSALAALADCRIVRGPPRLS